MQMPAWLPLSSEALPPNQQQGSCWRWFWCYQAELHAPAVAHVEGLAAAAATVLAWQHLLLSHAGSCTLDRPRRVRHLCLGAKLYLCRWHPQCWRCCYAVLRQRQLLKWLAVTAAGMLFEKRPSTRLRWKWHPLSRRAGLPVWAERGEGKFRQATRSKECHIPCMPSHAHTQHQLGQHCRHRLDDSHALW